MQGLESTRPPCRTTRNLTASPPPPFPSSPTLASTPRLYYSPLQLTNTKFKEASWDWVQNTATATSKWGGIEDWDVSIVTNMDRSFSSSRNEAGGQAASGNLQAKVWTSRADLRKWDTSQVTSMQRLFYQAKKFNGDVSTWDVARVITFQQVFDECSHFNGDVSSNDNPPNAMFTLYTIDSFTSATAAAVGFLLLLRTTYEPHIFHPRPPLPSPLASLLQVSTWSVGEGTDFYAMFKKAEAFFGSGLDSWDVAKGERLAHMFQGTKQLKADLSSWSVGNAIEMHCMSTRLPPARAFLPQLLRL